MKNIIFETKKIKKGDKVKVLSGKDKGKVATIEKVMAKDNKVIAAGINMVKRHLRKYGQMEGGIVELTKPIDLSNVMVICPNCDKPTRVGFEVKDGKKTRICKKCKGVIKYGA